MSIIYCQDHDKHIDTDFDTDHSEGGGECLAYHDEEDFSNANIEDWGE